jgi:hypothetical protein
VTDSSTAHGHEATAAQPASPRGWRKRHPVLARTLLYAVLLGVLAIPAVLWVRAREKYLWARVANISVEVQVDQSGARALQSLDEEFSEWGFLPNPALSDPLRARVERLRGVVAARLQRDRAGTERAFTRARELDRTPASVVAVDLEWAACLLALGDLEGARERVPRDAPADLTLSLWHHLLRAQIEKAQGAALGRAETDGTERQRLEDALERLARPLPQEPEVWLLLGPRRPAVVALEATEWLADGLPADSTKLVPLWVRMVELAPEDPDTLLPATEALVAAGDAKAARRAWRELRRVDPQRAERALAKNGALRVLDTP